MSGNVSLWEAVIIVFWVAVGWWLAEGLKALTYYLVKRRRDRKRRERIAPYTGKNR